MKRLSLLAALIGLLAPFTAAAQQPPTVSPIANPSVYAVNAAALSAAMTYCGTKYKGIDQGTPGAACFEKARNLLGEMKLSGWSGGIDAKCTDRANYNRCITPEIGRLVYALNDTFASHAL